MSSIKKVISLLTIVFITIVSCDDNKNEKPISSKEELRITFPLVGGYYYNQTMEKCDYTSEMRYGKSVFSGKEYDVQYSVNGNCEDGFLKRVDVDFGEIDSEGKFQQIPLSWEGFCMEFTMKYSNQGITSEVYKLHKNYILSYINSLTLSKKYKKGYDKSENLKWAELLLNKMIGQQYFLSTDNKVLVECNVFGISEGLPSNQWTVKRCSYYYLNDWLDDEKQGIEAQNSLSSSLFNENQNF
jgi:hypothetical protein